MRIADRRKVPLVGTVPTRVLAALVAVAVGCAAGVSARAAVTVDYGVRLVGPVGSNGARVHAHVVARRPFYIRMELSTDAARPASVTYDIDLPTGVEVMAPVRLETGAVTSGCLRGCSVGWNAAHARTLSIYYALVPPGPGAFVVEATIVSTGGPDARSRDNTATATIDVVPARLTLGLPVLANGAPVAGRLFTVIVPVRRGGVPVRPGRATCRATIGGRSLAGAVSLARGTIGCTWSIPDGSGGRAFRTTVIAAAGPLRVARSWLYSIGRR